MRRSAWPNSIWRQGVYAYSWSERWPKSATIWARRDGRVQRVHYYSRSWAESRYRYQGAVG